MCIICIRHGQMREFTSPNALPKDLEIGRGQLYFDSQEERLDVVAQMHLAGIHPLQILDKMGIEVDEEHAAEEVPAWFIHAQISALKILLTRIVEDTAKKMGLDWRDERVVERVMPIAMARLTPQQRIALEEIRKALDDDDDISPFGRLP